MKTNKIEVKEESENINQVLSDRLKKYEADLERAKDVLYNVPTIIQNKKELYEVNKKAQEIQLAKFNKLNFDFEYEKDSEFQNLMVRKQKLLNSINDLEAKREIQDLHNLQSKMHEQVEYYENQIEIIKNQMKGDKK